MDIVEQIEQAEPVEAPEPMPVLSVADHAATFGKEAMKEAAALDTAPLNETPEEKIVREQKRDNKTGQYREGKVRHRAASQQARAEDVPRIQKLTAEKNTEKERADRAEAELATLKRNHAPAAQIARAEARVEQTQPQATGDPEPQETDAKFGGDYGKFLRAAAGWDLRQQQRTERQQQQESQTKQQRAEQDRVILKNFSDRVNTARTKYADFDAVALGETPIREGSAVDAWITEHKAGPDVLYYLHQTAHRPELESLLTKPIIDQLDDLTLLAQRLLPSSSVAAGTTGAAPRQFNVVLPHKPPTPVRTEAQRTGDAPPPTDGSLSVAEHERAFGLKRR